MHIEERYGLFTIIVLGESILAASIGIRQIGTEGVTAGLIVIAIGGLLLAFGAWWLYFDHPGHLTPSRDVAFRWGYTHVVVFTSLAALGAGLYVAAEAEAGHAMERTGSLAVTIPVAGFLLGLVLLMLATHHAVNLESIGSKLSGATVIVLLGTLRAARCGRCRQRRCRGPPRDVDDLRSVPQTTGVRPTMTADTMVLAGTTKGLFILRSDDGREHFEVSGRCFPGRRSTRPASTPVAARRGCSSAR